MTAPGMIAADDTGTIPGTAATGTPGTTPPATVATTCPGITAPGAAMTGIPATPAAGRAPGWAIMVEVIGAAVETPIMPILVTMKENVLGIKYSIG